MSRIYVNRLDDLNPPTETKREGTHKSEAIVRTLWKHSEGGITRLPASINEVINHIVVSNSNSTTINEDPVLNKTVALLGQSMRETEDQLMRDMMEGTASVVNCVNGVNGDVPTEITTADVQGVTAALQNNDGDFIANVIEGANKFGTGPVPNSYFAMCDTGMIGQLENCEGWINVAQYPSQNNLSPAEWGSVGNVRFFLSSRGSVTTGASLLGNDVYNIFVAAQDSHAKIEQNSISAKFIYHPPGHGDDPAELRQTAAWRMAQVPTITNDAWITNLRATLA